MIEDVGDPYTPPEHFLTVARCYRLAILLELFRTFPELIESQAAPVLAFEVAPHNCDDQVQLVLGLAFGILSILESLPNSSGTISTQLLLLLIAGSALGYADLTRLDDAVTGSRYVYQEVMRWRAFVRQRTRYVHVAVGLRPVKQAAAILEEVWSRMDILGRGTQAEGQDSLLATQVHWLDVMSEKRLDTMLG